MHDSERSHTDECEHFDRREPELKLSEHADTTTICCKLVCSLLIQEKSYRRLTVMAGR